ncbi:predicted protein [Nematostella vectensis]|uniref:Enoyl reductase (ER) domain-containing protein n=1 Tax=Nematostella vectensis TaxID=45351 RepID=A7SQZ0_NEMVE|nr:predicted protein [Nematostella vectensis]|eukprot:XP_001625955.1 predicted protein [Nematostella vectensis]
MDAWCIRNYTETDNLKLETFDTPDIESDAEVLVKVHASSVNPIDVEMRRGYGTNLLNTWRKLVGVEEFPLICGRDFSGVVVKTGRRVRRFRPGMEVWGTPSVVSAVSRGCHAQYLKVKQEEIAAKPVSLSHVEAASLPYVICTVWAGLVSRGGLGPATSAGKRVLVLGGSGGIGTFAIQLLKAWGATVITTCSTDAIDLVTSLGADHAIDYITTDEEAELRKLGGYDVILDPFGGEYEILAPELLSDRACGVYISIIPPLLPKTDALGLGKGVLSSGKSFVSASLKVNSLKGASVKWGFFTPNPGALDHVKLLVNQKKVKPVIQAVFPFSQVPDAYANVEAGHTRGKTIIQVAMDTQPLS